MKLDDSQLFAIQQQERVLTSLYGRVKVAIIASEKRDVKQRLSVPAINELRNALDHSMRVKTVMLFPEENWPPEARPDPGKYCLANMDKAIGHIYRAGYDALDVIAYSYSEEVNSFIQSYDKDVLLRVFANYTEHIKKPVEEALDLFTQAKACKDVDGSASLASAFQKYEEGIALMVMVSKRLDEGTVLLTELDTKEKKRQKREATAYVAGIAGCVIGFIGIILGIIPFILKLIHP